MILPLPPCLFALALHALGLPSTAPATQGWELQQVLAGRSDYSRLEGCEFAGDVDADGRTDILLRFPAASSGNHHWLGRVVVHSGVDGRVLLAWEGVEESEVLGALAVAAGDVDADGHDDVLVTSRPVAGNRVTIYSGATGSALLELSEAGSLYSFGLAAAGLGDVNGDGHGDLAIGDPDVPPDGAGIVWVYSGATGGLLYRVSGGEPHESFGRRVASAGDVDGDGAGDFVVAAYHAYMGDGSNDVTVHSGASGALLHRFTGDLAEGFGLEIAGGGDADGDGIGDILVAAPLTNKSSLGVDGAAELYSGRTGSRLRRLEGEPGEGFASGVAFVSDQDFDGDDEVLIASYNSEHVSLFSGGDGQLLRRLSLGGYRTAFGWQVAGGGDVDQDGRGDFMVLAPSSGARGPGSGCAVVYSGKTLREATRLWGHARFNQLGASVASCGDFDGDGAPEIAVGCPVASPQGAIASGAVLVLSGRDRTLLHHWDGAYKDDHFGQTLAAIGDVDRDGVPDLLVGAPNARTSMYGRHGRVDLYSGASGKHLRKHEGWTDLCEFGFAIAVVRDRDDDGVEDYAVGAPKYMWNLAGDRGMVYLFSGRHGYLLQSFQAEDTWDFGYSIADAGLVNNDDIPDLAVSALTQRYSFRGALFLYSGSSGARIRRILSPAEEDDYGWSIAGVGDVDLDGRDDILVGAPGAASHTGAAYLHSGRTGDILYFLQEPDTGGSFGWSVAAIPDSDGDGRSDWAVGAPFAGPLPIDTLGQVHIYSSRDGSQVKTFTATEERSAFGTALASTAVPESNALQALWIGAPCQDWDAGALYALLPPAGGP